MTRTLVTIALSLSVLASPALARNTTTADEQKAKPSTSATTADQKKYCIQEALTGSRIAQKKCLTKAQWAKEGVDIENPENN